MWEIQLQCWNRHWVALKDQSQGHLVFQGLVGDTYIVGTRMSQKREIFGQAGFSAVPAVVAVGFSILMVVDDECVPCKSSSVSLSTASVSNFWCQARFYTIRKETVDA